MQSYLRLAQPALSAAIVPPDRWATLHRVAQPFPPVSCMFETRLSQVPPQTDLLLRFLPGDFPAAYAGLMRVCAAAAPVFQPTWGRLAHFYEGWLTQCGPLAATLLASWLEFDLPSSSDDISIPSFFADFVPQAACPLETIVSVLGLLAITPAHFLRPLADCVAALPPGAQIFSLGVMFGRPNPDLRMCISGLTPAQVRPYLAQIGWPGDPSLSCGDLDSLAEGVNHIALALDVGAQVLPNLGIEYHIEDRLRPSKQRWQNFLDRLRSIYPCSALHCMGALDWIGYTTARRYGDDWPAHLRQQAHTAGPDLLSTMLRRLNHVKIVYRPGHTPEIKAYLEQMHVWLCYDPLTRQSSLQRHPSSLVY